MLNARSWCTSRCRTSYCWRSKTSPSGVTERLATQRLSSNAGTPHSTLASWRPYGLQVPLRKIPSFGDSITGGSADRGDARHYLSDGRCGVSHAHVHHRRARAPQIATSAASFVPTDLGEIAHEVRPDVDRRRAAEWTLDRCRSSMSMPFRCANYCKPAGHALKFRRKDVAPHVQLRASTDGDGFAQSRLFAEWSKRSSNVQRPMRERSIQARDRPGDLPKDCRAARRHDAATAVGQERRSTSPSQSRVEADTQHDDAGQAQDPDHYSHLRR